MSANYTEPEDLLADESFLSWYFKSGAKDQKDWDRWMAEHPEREKLVQQAVALLETVRVREAEIPVQQKQAAEKALLGKLAPLQSRQTPTAPLQSRESPTAEPRSGIYSLYSYRRWMVAAAILLLLGAGVVVVAIRSASDRVVKTAYGQITSRDLPDGSEVTMDANSRLRYSKGWKDGSSREVWIDGEAFFHVRKTPSGSRFIVHTDHFDIIVTGTRFNVVNRNGVENVLLQEGSVILHDKNGKELTMTPGEFVSFDKQQLAKRAVQPDSVTAWKDRKLVFDKTPLRELVGIVNDHYGVHIQLENASLGDSTISAILPNNNLDVLLQALEATSEFTIIRKDDQITIAAR
ncbi:MAG TPA: FecR domain-containing protein [Puia sp.]|nr:FecR domain-containing protein [Puia sp.]